MRIEADPRRNEFAICRGLNPNLFFPERGEPYDEALAACENCPLKIPCLEYALANGEKDGIWGGTTGRQRRKLKRQRELAKRQIAS